MNRQYEINLNIRVTFDKPFVVKFESDTIEIQRQTERLDTAGKSLGATIAANTPTTKKET